jgi:tRNA pseudouridine32 synthase / 23S rRNA pseudouridine746 synthase
MDARGRNDNAWVLHLDAHLLILNKPAGLAVHPGPQTPRSLEDHLDALRYGFKRRPQPAHRLDRDTSGCLVLGRHPKALKRLGQLFEGARVAKTYWAVLDGAPTDAEGLIDAPLLKVSSKAAGWRIVVDPKGKPARTRWRVLDRRGDRSLVEFRPETGRTHQIRVHAAQLGAPIVGDPVYGKGAGLLLHARAVSVPYRENAPPIEAVAPLPATFGRFGFAPGFGDEAMV